MKKNIIALLLSVVSVALFCVAATTRVVYVNSPTLIQSGTNTTTADGTVTQTFTTAYTVVPKVVVSQVGKDTTTTNTVAITITNFVVGNNKNGGGFQWISVGTP